MLRFYHGNFRRNSSQRCYRKSANVRCERCKGNCRQHGMFCVGSRLAVCSFVVGDIMTKTILILLTLSIITLTLLGGCVDSGQTCTIIQNGTENRAYCTQQQRGNSSQSSSSDIGPALGVLSLGVGGLMVIGFFMFVLVSKQQPNNTRINHEHF